MIKIDESYPDQDSSLPKRGILKSKDKSKIEAMSINFEKNLENLIVQIYSKKVQKNLKRRKVNVFKNDDYLPD